jgi:hypothetical protein
MIADDWQEIAAAIDSWLDGALDAPAAVGHDTTASDQSM